MLTTFNEVDMTNVMAARAKHQDAFEKKHRVRLGFMSFFTKASVLALKEIPAVNAEVSGNDLIYKNHYDIGVAVSTPQGLVVPVVRGADRLSFAEIEKTITDLGLRARDGKLTMAEMTGGTFTITKRRCVWFFDVDAHFESASVGYFGDAQDPKTPHGGGG